MVFVFFFLFSPYDICTLVHETPLCFHGIVGFCDVSAILLVTHVPVMLELSSLASPELRQGEAWLWVFFHMTWVSGQK